MTKRKERQVSALTRVKELVRDERSTPAMREQAVDVAYGIGVTEGRLAGALSALDKIKLGAP